MMKMARVETFTLDEFTTGAWSDRPEYSSEDIDFAHITALHNAMDGFVGCFDNGKRIAAFLHENGSRFEAWVYLVGTWDMAGNPLIAEPFMWVYGTTFDGVRECSGGQNHSGDLLEMAEGMRWLHELLAERWPRFKAWYEDIDLDRRLASPTALAEAQAEIARLQNLIARYAQHVGAQEGVDFLESLLPIGYGSANIDGHPYHPALTEAEAMEIRGYSTTA